ncbi:hypothetical protein [Acinetobacter higginsii]|uniref:hypothetical protein n=1 Tax=Acinetobacter higginsii TaxID=70347 RepID=UPI001F4A1C84|nr:hypothetical protein [Acinetobacter higginsii]MCH7341484.1 hypothetical protein [Acinetobacter higginsii]
MYKLLITGVLLAITSTYALAKPNAMTKAELEKYYEEFSKTHKTPKDEENKFYVKYDATKKEALEGYSLDLNFKRQEKCADEIFSQKGKKKLNELAKGKTGIVELTYFCGR